MGITSSPEQTADERSIQPFSFESFEPLESPAPAGLPAFVGDADVRFEFATRFVPRTQVDSLRAGELMEMNSQALATGPDSKAEEVIILANGEPIGTGTIVVVEDRLSVQVTRLNESCRTEC